MSFGGAEVLTYLSLSKRDQIQFKLDNPAVKRDLGTKS